MHQYVCIFNKFISIYIYINTTKYNYSYYLIVLNITNFIHIDLVKYMYVNGSDLLKRFQFKI